jgi:uncharacterized membrane protein YqiK
MDTTTTVILAAVILVIMLVIFAIGMWLSRLYMKAPANRAFVRVGGPGNTPKVIMNGGALVLGLIHEVTWVDLGTMTVEIERTENNALLTKDPQYADIRAIFYIKVDPTVEGITTAARTIGSKTVEKNVVKDLVDAKLDGALRDVAATFTLLSLHQERENFIQEVQNRVKGDLEENGLVLESVSILTLRAARQGTFPTDDVFGAQVARANAEFIRTAERERNDIERRTEMEIKQRNFATEKEKLALEQDLAFSTATQEREVMMRRATEKASAERSILEQELSVEKSRLAKDQAIRTQQIENEQLLAVQDQRRQQEMESAEIVRTQTIEVANQAKQIAVLNEEQRRESAEKERLVVAAQREEASQAVKTVEETSKARREAQIYIIEAEREAQRSMIERRNEVEIEALKKIRGAEAQAQSLKAIAEAEFEAAQKQAETKRTGALADSDAAKALAEGEKARVQATGLAEAEVIRAKADATQQEALVIRAKGLAEAEAVRAKGLAEAEAEKAKAEALAAYDGVSQKLELEKIRLQAQIEIGVARAKAMGDAVANMQIKMFGTPEAADSILRLMSFADGMNDVVNATPAPVRDLGNRVVNSLLGSNGGNGNSANGGAIGGVISNGGMGVDEMATIFPQLMALAERTLPADRLKTATVDDALDMLDERVLPEEKPLVTQGRLAVSTLPFLGGAKFADMYERYKALGG